MHGCKGTGHTAHGRLRHPARCHQREVLERLGTPEYAQLAAIHALIAGHQLRIAPGSGHLAGKQLGKCCVLISGKDHSHVHIAGQQISIGNLVDDECLGAGEGHRLALQLGNILDGRVLRHQQLALNGR